VNINSEVKLEGFGNPRGLEGIKNRRAGRREESLAGWFSFLDSERTKAEESSAEEGSLLLDQLSCVYDSVSALDILSDYESEDAALQLHG